MHARVTTVKGDLTNPEAGIENFRSTVVPFTRDHGGKAVVLLVNRETGEAVSISFWEDEAAMRASEEGANQLRAEAAGRLRAEPRSVDQYEVAVYEQL